MKKRLTQEFRHTRNVEEENPRSRQLRRSVCGFERRGAKFEFLRSFLRDLGALRDAEILSRIRESIEQAASLSDILNLTKLQGGSHLYRVRVGDFRLDLGQ